MHFTAALGDGHWYRRYSSCELGRDIYILGTLKLGYSSVFVLQYYVYNRGIYLQIVNKVYYNNVIFKQYKIVVLSKIE